MAASSANASSLTAQSAEAEVHLVLTFMEYPKPCFKHVIMLKSERFKTLQMGFREET